MSDQLNDWQSANQPTSLFTSKYLFTLVACLPATEQSAGKYENKTGPDQRSILQVSKINYIINILLLFDPLHYLPSSNLAKNAIAVNEEHKLSTVQQSNQVKTLSTTKPLQGFSPSYCTFM